MKTKRKMIIACLAVMCVILLGGWQIHDALYNSGMLGDNKVAVHTSVSDVIADIGDRIEKADEYTENVGADVTSKGNSTMQSVDALEVGDTAVLDFEITEKMRAVENAADPNRYTFAYPSNSDVTLKVFEGYAVKIGIPVTLGGNYHTEYDGILEYSNGMINLKLVATEDYDSGTDEHLRITVDDGVSCKYTDFGSFGLGEGYSDTVYSILVKPDVKLTGLNVGIASKMKSGVVRKGDVVVSCVLYPMNYKPGDTMRFTLGNNKICMKFVEGRDWSSIDNNNDGEVNASDASSILVTSARLGTGNTSVIANKELDYTKMDVNLDGRVDASDASEVLIMASEMGVGKHFDTVDDYFAAKSNKQ